jgi:hypothetical protein
MTAPGWVPWVLTAVLAIATLVLALRAQSSRKNTGRSEVGAVEEPSDRLEGEQRP